MTIADTTPAARSELWPALGYALAGAVLLAGYGFSAEFELLLLLPLLILFWRIGQLGRRVQRLEARLEAGAAEAALSRARDNQLEFRADEILPDPTDADAAGPGEIPARYVAPASVPPPRNEAAEAARRSAWNGPGASVADAAATAEPGAAASAAQKPAAGLLTAALRGFFTDGNIVARIGILVLFFGVAFLLKYAADNALLPIGLRLAGAAAGGLVLLLVGWRLRRARGIYALLLQGAGIGVVYLTLFAAARLYDLIPLGGAFVLMLAVVVLATALAVLQDARHLAAFAAAGGFLAPILTAGEHGNQVLLFGYYACLNAGIVGVAWFRAWRELNLLGFLFTFVIGGAWGYFSYRPEYFATSLGFLVLFVVFFTAIAVLFAHRAPLRLRGYVDGTLVFGVPLVGFSLLSAMLRDQPMQLALAALTASAFYVLLARALWRRQVEGMRLLTEAFLAVGVILASLAIPLALDSNWTTALWAAEGAGLVWIGVAQQRRAARWFGLLLQLGASLAFVFDRDWMASAWPVLNATCVGSSIIALAGLLSAWLLWRQRDGLLAPERAALPLMLVWALGWWFGGGWLETLRIGGSIAIINAHALLFNSASLALLLVLRRRLSWLPLDRLLVVFPGVLWAHLWVLVADGIPALSGRGWLLWPSALVLGYWLLWHSRELWPDPLRRRQHALMLWFVVACIGHESYRHLDALVGLGQGWALAALLPAALAALWLLPTHAERMPWPVAENPEWYRGATLHPIVLAVMAWILMVSASSANPAPLAYVPIFNPVELMGLAAVLVLLLVELRGTADGGPSLPLPPGAVAAVSAFVWVTVVLARTVHFRAGISYDPAALFHSQLFQTSIAVVWTVLAMLVTVVASRRGRRPLWYLGAGLLLVVVAKLFLIDLGGTGTIERIVSFILVGVLMLAIGYFSPIPPSRREPS